MRSGLALSTIYSYSAGNRKLTPEARRLIARALGCRPRDIPLPRKKP